MDTRAYAVTDRGAAAVATPVATEAAAVFVVAARRLRHIALGVRALQLSSAWQLQNEALVRLCL
jgi:hypothetical protein